VVNGLAQGSIKVGYGTNPVYLQRVAFTKGTKATIGPGATTVGAEGRFNQLKLIAALGTE
jgi:hypothetical protein